ncbi:MAG: hypothetical protein QM778_33925 [Myxococcales bacterium]
MVAAAVVAAGLWLVVSPSVRASLVLAMDLSELVKEAQVVVLARVMGQRSSYDERGRIVTDVQMQVEQAEKGDLAPGASVVVRKLGGAVNGVSMRIEGEPSFTVGETVLLFGSDPQQRALLRPVGMSQGALRVFERDGARWVRSGTSNLALVKKSAGTLTPQPAAVEEPRPLDDVLGEIRSLVAQTKQK